MDLRVLRYFLAVVDTGSVLAASDLVHVAQPSLSRQLRSLEVTLNLRLFAREGRGLILTAAGRAFLPVARDLVNRAAQAQATVATMARGTATRLTVAAAHTTSVDIVTPFIVSSGPEGLIVNVIERSPAHVYDMLATSSADLAVGTRVPPAELESVVLGNAYLWAQFPSDHALAGRPSVSLRELLTYPLIVLSSDQGVRRMFDAAVGQEGLTYTAAFETESPYVAQALAAAGRGICVLSDDARYGLSVTPIATSGGELTISLYGVWDPLHYASDRIRSCVDDLSDFIRELYPQS